MTGAAGAEATHPCGVAAHLAGARLSQHEPGERRPDSGRAIVSPDAGIQGLAPLARDGTPARAALLSATKAVSPIVRDSGKVWSVGREREMGATVLASLPAVDIRWYQTVRIVRAAGSVVLQCKHRSLGTCQPALVAFAAWLGRERWAAAHRTERSLPVGIDRDQPGTRQVSSARQGRCPASCRQWGTPLASATAVAHPVAARHSCSAHASILLQRDTHRSLSDI